MGVNWSISGSDTRPFMLSDESKLTFMSNSLSLYEFDLRKLKGEQISKTDKEGSSESNHFSQDISEVFQLEGHIISNSLFLATRFKQKSAFLDYLKAIELHPEQCRCYFDYKASVYIVTFKDTLLVVDLEELSLEAGNLDTKEIRQMTTFQRDKNCRII